MDFNNIAWHDGRLIKCISENDTNTLDIFVSVYKDHDSPDRVELVVSFSEIEEVVMAYDSKELADNYNAGNINDAYQKESIYRFYLVDGYIKVKTKAVSIK